MNSQTNETLTIATSDIKEDLDLNTDNEDVGYEEVSVLSDECVDNNVKEVNAKLYGRNKTVLNQNSVYLKVKKTSEVTLPMREPHPLFLGRPDKKRRNRGSRKNKKLSNVPIDGLEASQMENSNEMQKVNNPKSNVTNIDMKASQPDVSNGAQNVLNESIEPMKSINSQPASPVNRKPVKIAVNASKTTQNDPKTKPITIDDLIGHPNSHL